jgi:citrate lyase beta subunit
LHAENNWQALIYARSRTVAAAALANLPVIDAPTFDLSSNDPLKADLQAAGALGFAGKAAIHPKQVAEINQSFTPSLEEVNAAKKIYRRESERCGRCRGQNGRRSRCSARAPSSLDCQSPGFECLA